MADQGSEATVYDEQWDAKEYLRHYYSTNVTAGDDRLIFEHLVDFLKQNDRVYQRAIDIGCGPTPHHAVPVLPWVKELHFADYLSANLEEIQHWLDGHPQAHNWDRWIGDILLLEGADESDLAAGIKRRKELAKERVANMQRCDLRLDQPLGQTEPYDLVMSFFCADAATNSREEWRLFMRNLFSTVKPGGDIFIVACENAQAYTSGKSTFPEANVGREDLLSVIENAPFDRSSVEVASFAVPDWADSGFAGIVIAKGRFLP